jgi:predicted amidohydrolase
MKFRNSMMVLGASLLCTPAAFAQDMAPAQPAQPATPAQAAPAPAAPAAAPGPVTDTEVSQFASAALAVEKIRKDTTVADADKNTKMAEAVKTAGLDPNRFNEISQAMQADPALNKKIQAAAAAQQPPAAGPTATPPATPAPK